MKQLITSFLLLFLLIPFQAVLPQEHTITQVLSPGVFMLDDGTAVRLADLAFPSEKDSNSVIAQMGSKVIKWQKQVLLGRAFIVKTDSLIAPSDGIKTVRLYKHLTFSDENIAVWFLREGMAAYIGAAGSEDYSKMQRLQRTAYNKQAGIWKQLDYIGRFRAERVTQEEISKMEYSETARADSIEKGAQIFKPGDHELIYMPTAYTMPAKHGYFTDYELLFLNFTYAVTSSTHIGALLFFPISDAFYEFFTLGIKQNYYSSEYFSSAVWGACILSFGKYAIGNTFSFGRPNNGLHIALGFVNGFESGKEDHNEVFLLAGYRYDIWRNFSAIIEYTSSESMMTEKKSFNGPNTLNGLVTLGFRFRSTHLSWEIAGARPTAGGSSDFIAIPIVKATYYF